MKVIDGVEYVTKQDFVHASAKITKKIAEETNDSMSGLMVVMVAAELNAELFQKENKEE